MIPNSSWLEQIKKSRMSIRWLSSQFIVVILLSAFSWVERAAASEVRNLPLRDLIPEYDISDWKKVSSRPT